MRIRAALSIGFTIDELGEIFAARDSGLAPCRQVHALATRKASALEARIAEMQRLLDSLKLALHDWERELGGPVLTSGPVCSNVSWPFTPRARRASRR